MAYEYVELERYFLRYIYVPTYSTSRVFGCIPALGGFIKRFGWVVVEDGDVEYVECLPGADGRMGGRVDIWMDGVQ